MGGPELIESIYMICHRWNYPKAQKNANGCVFTRETHSTAVLEFEKRCLVKIYGQSPAVDTLRRIYFCSRLSRGNESLWNM